MTGYRSIFLDEDWAHQAHYGWHVLHEVPGLRVLSQRRYGLIRQLALVEMNGIAALRGWLDKTARMAWRSEIVIHDFSGSFDPADLTGLAFAPAGKGDALLNLRTMVIDLRRAEDELMAVMSSDHRRKIRKAAKAGATFSARDNPDADEITEFMVLQNALARERGFQPARQETVGRMYAAGNATLYRVTLADEVSCLHVYRTAGKAIFMHGAARDLGSSGIGQLLHWKAMLDLKARGINWYDLGGVTVFDDANGIYRFKRMFGAAPVDLGREWLHRGRAVRTARAARSLAGAT
ncbi:GNAT family N-acetyltransferase [Anianabacter salinae]|uniref:GNAT family N-acetyltransferase n=1 Tax=Anianabacter salinae TaxID=2851023 RepID=UPI00225E5FBA|nr:GNAT family N-acetyltransferase [Anianabacter salinae]MBV0913477.1 aminoacyltransferase [Anianabacter salinae]